MGKRVVILGAGFGGLRAALILGKKLGHEHEIVLVDKNSHHTFTPLLYETATTSKEIANYTQLHEVATYGIKGILNGSLVNFIQSGVKVVDVSGGDVHLDTGEKIKYDYLVIALGSETNFFDIPGLKEKALELKNFTDAIRIRDTIWDLIQGGKTDLKVIIGGGGSTGVEFAAELQNWLCEVKKTNQECNTEVTIVEAGPTILNGFENKIINKVARRLKHLGVNVIVNDSIAKISKNKVTLKSAHELEFDVLVWAGGVKANSVIQAMPFKFEKGGRSEVSESMNCLPQTPTLKLYGKIYGVGDIVCIYDKYGHPVPMVARAAILQATVAAKNIICEIEGREPQYTYKPMNYPYIIPVGGKYAVAKIGPLCLSGFLGWALKGLIELNYILSIMPFTKGIKIWLKGFKIFIQNDRLG